MWLVVVCTNFLYSCFWGIEREMGKVGWKSSEQCKSLRQWRSWDDGTQTIGLKQPFYAWESMNLYIYMVFILHMSDTRVMLICFAHAKHNDLGICSTWFMGCGDSSLKVHNWCHGCPTPKELTQLSVNLTMEKAGKECRDAFNYTTSPLSCCTYSTIALPRNAQPLPSNIRTFVAP